jgi:phosphohistidine phosphatase SixA
MVEVLMRLLLLRHALADAERAPFTHAGRRELRRVVYRLRRLQKSLDIVACGARPGASEAAKIVARGYGKTPVQTLSALDSTGAGDQIIAWLRTQASDAVVALIGQEPELGRLVGLLTAGKPNRTVALQTHGLCRIDCDGLPTPAGGMLRWLLTPMQLKKLKV